MQVIINFEFKILNFSLENNHKFYYMIEECLDFLMSVKDCSDLLVNKTKLLCLLKISIFLKKNLVFKYPIIINNLIEIYKELLGLFD